MSFSNQRRKYSYHECIEQIRQAIAEGAHSKEEIAGKIGLSSSIVTFYAWLEDIVLPRKNPSRQVIREGRSDSYQTEREHILKRIKSVLEKGVHDLDAIIQETIGGTSWSSGRIATQAKAVASDMGVTLTGGKNVHYARCRGEHIDNLVWGGVRQREIGKAMGGVTRERARQYIHARGLYRAWAEAMRKRQCIEEYEERSRQEARQEIRGGLVSLLRKRVYQRASKEGWAAQKAIEYFFAVDTSYQFDQIKRVFENYYNVSNAGAKVSLRVLGRDAGIPQPVVGCILRKVGLKPMYTNYDRLTSAELEAIKRSERIPLSDGDVAYFIGINKNTVKNRRHFRLSYFNFIKSYCGYSRGWGCSFSTGSQIYKAQGAGFTPEEICQLLDIKQKTVDDVIKQREWAEREIICALRKLYDRMDINQPYRNLDFLQ